MALTLRFLANRSHSPIVEVAARNSLFDTFISAAVGIAFVITLLLQNSRWSPAARYADPVIMLVTAVLAAPQPIRIIRSNWRQLLGRAPDRAVQDQVSATIEEVLASVPHSETCLRLTEVGRYLYLHLYVIVPDNSHQPIGIKVQAQIRRRVHDALAAEFLYLALDISFTSDVLWAHSSIPSAHHTTSHGTAQPTER